MYGLLLDSIQKFLREKYGEHYWVVIRRRAKLDNHWFVTHEVYSDSVMNNLVEAAASTLGENRDEVMRMFGEYFVQNIGRYGYARLLRVLGRDLRDFLNGLDDLHEYLRFSYPKMRAPSFFCEQETPEGVVMHYTTKRRGYLPYVIGQLHAVGLIYQKKLEISVLRENISAEGTHVVLHLQFDNSELLKERLTNLSIQQFQIKGPTFLNIFPFAVVFNPESTVVSVGSKLQDVMPNLKGQRLEDVFEHERPLNVILKWDSIVMHTNCVFEWKTIERMVQRQPKGVVGKSSPSMQYTGDPPQLKLKGQMILVSDSKYMLFLCSPIMGSPEELYESGIFISDLSMHDSSRDYILAGSQQNPELTLALNQEQIRSRQLEDNIQKTDGLLYQMIPKIIADKLREGETPLNTCKQWQCVSILFADIVGFTAMSSRLTPMEVVCLLNAIYVIFDELCEKHCVYKVQTIGDACMVLCGAPVVIPNHAELIVDYGFSIIDAIGKVRDPSTQDSLAIRVGVHSGTVVAGVVGASFLRYDVFGDTVNTAARMEATGKPMKIHISEATAELLDGSNFIVEERGEMEVKGKGTMKTFWVTGRKSPSNTLKPIRPKSPIFNSKEPFDTDSYQAHHELWPRTKSVPVIRTPYTKARESLTPEKWPLLDESLASPTTAVNNSTHTSACKRILDSGSKNNEGINIEDVAKIQQLAVSNRVSDELKSLPTESLSTLDDFAQLAEENAQRARQLANWAKHIASVSRDNKQTAVVKECNLSNNDQGSLQYHSNYTRSLLGTSVDEEDVLPSTPNVDKKYCIIS